MSEHGPHSYDPWYQGVDPWQRPSVWTVADGVTDGTSAASGVPTEVSWDKRFDQPPSWDGSKPEKGLHPYLKLLKAWLRTTQIDKTQQGFLILRFAKGDLRTLIDEIEEDVLVQRIALDKKRVGKLLIGDAMVGGASWSATKKVFLIVPTLVLLAYLNAADFSRQALTIHVPIYALLCILPKLPGMHRVRILGINRTVGFDESFDDEAKKGKKASRSKSDDGIALSDP